MNGKSQNHQSFVGAMKIARHPRILASTPMNGNISRLPQRGSRGGLHHLSCRPETATLRAIFIAPTKLKSFYIPPFIGVHSLSLAFARQLPQRGSREGCVPFIVSPGNRNVAGDFHRPYERRFPFNRVLAEIRGCGRFSSPLRSSEVFTFYHSMANGTCNQRNEESV